MRPSASTTHGAILLCALSALSCRSNKLAKIADTVDEFTQGATNTNVLAFTQKPALVDVLFIVRNGPTMCEKQQQLATKFSQFITTLQQQNLDFHVGVVATDFDSPTFSGKLVAKAGNPLFVTPQTANLNQVFSDNVLQVGTTGTPKSQGLLAALAAVTPPLVTGANNNFLRDGASLAMILVSDQDDYSFYPPPQSPDVDYYVTFFSRSFAHLKGSGNEDLISLSAIVGADANGPTDCAGSRPDAGTTSCPYPDTTGYAGYRSSGVAGQTRGLVQSICASDFGPLLTTLATHIGGLTRTFDLAAIPVGKTLDPNTITVTVTPVTGAPFQIPQDATNGWTYDATNQALDFHGTGVPAPNAKVAINYTLLERAFPLTNQPDVTTITVQVTVKGVATTVPQTTNDPTQGWSYDPNTNSVVFGTAVIPPVGSTIDVDYRF